MSGLHVGCGARIEDGWTNVDLEPLDARVVRVDVRQQLPFDGGTFDMVYSEHFLEHIERHEAVLFLAECFRVLKPGGALRVSTPDMEFLARLYLEAVTGNGPDGLPTDPKDNPLKYYKPVGWEPVDPAELINGGMRLWEHRFIWDYLALSKTLLGLGFDLVGRAPYRRTRYEGMLLEGRPDLTELIVECNKPADVAHASLR